VNSRIQFFSENINFIFKNKIQTRNWLAKIIEEENKGLLNINYIFCLDEFLLELNKKYLNHSTLTDILTFPDDSVNGKISGDIYISIERIRENSEKYAQSFDKELHRVMVHGVLHLLGYKDKTKKEKETMTLKEDYYLKKI
jgi:probable rRNA maturation factor